MFYVVNSEQVLLVIWWPLFHVCDLDMTFTLDLGSVSRFLHLFFQLVCQFIKSSLFLRLHVYLSPSTYLSNSICLIFYLCTNPSVPSFLCRFPTFTDAVRDLDDCLTLCFTFANFPATKRTQVELVHTCRRLTGMTDWLTLDWAAVFFRELDWKNKENVFILTGKTSFFLENRTDIEHYKENVFILTQTGKTILFF